jgi:ribose transport system permease protein
MLGKYTLLGLLGVLIIVFSLLRPSTFPTSSNAITIISSQDVFVALACGLLFPLVAGEFDLSIGYALGFTAMELAVFTSQDHMNVGLAMVLTLLTGVVVGGINAVLVLRFRVNAFIATLGTGTVRKGSPCGFPAAP